MAAALYDKFPGSTWIRVQVCQALESLCRMSAWFHISHVECTCQLILTILRAPRLRTEW